MHFRRPATGPNHSPARRSLRVAAAAAAAGLALSACSAGDAEQATAPALTETCVAFSYGTLRTDVRQPTPKTASAIMQLLPIAYGFQYGQEPPAELMSSSSVSGGTNPATGEPRTVAALGQEMDTMFAAQHPGIGTGGAVPDDRASLCFKWDLRANTVAVSSGSYILPFRPFKDVGRDPLIPTQVLPGDIAKAS
jgi:hypothetical protein